MLWYVCVYVCVLKCCGVSRLCADYVAVGFISVCINRH